MFTTTWQQLLPLTAMDVFTELWRQKKLHSHNPRSPAARRHRKRNVKHPTVELFIWRLFNPLRFCICKTSPGVCLHDITAACRLHEWLSFLISSCSWASICKQHKSYKWMNRFPLSLTFLPPRQAVRVIFLTRVEQIHQEQSLAVIRAHEGSMCEHERAAAWTLMSIYSGFESWISPHVDEQLWFRWCWGSVSSDPLFSISETLPFAA